MACSRNPNELADRGVSDRSDFFPHRDLLRTESLQDGQPTDLVAVLEEPGAGTLHVPSMDRGRRGAIDLPEGIVSLPPFFPVATCIPGAVGSETEGQFHAVAVVDEQRLQGGPKEHQAVRKVRTARLRLQPVIQGGLDVPADAARPTARCRRQHHRRMPTTVAGPPRIPEEGYRPAGARSPIDFARLSAAGEVPGFAVGGNGVSNW